VEDPPDLAGGRPLRDPYSPGAGALDQRAVSALIRKLLGLLKAERLCEDRWRLPDDTIIAGSIADMARSVDCVKQLEAYAYRAKPHEAGEDELMIVAEYTGAGWRASITPFIGCGAKHESGLHPSEALARIDALAAFCAGSRRR